MKQQHTPKSHHKLIGTIIVLATITAIVLPLTISSINDQDPYDSPSQSEISSVHSEQSSCLADAQTTYDQAWDAADTDNDDKVAYSDGASDITIAYYDSVISCHQLYGSNESASYINDYQAKRQQETDKYTAWLEASRQPTYIQTYESAPSPSVNCTSNSIGPSTYTRCY